MSEGTYYHVGAEDDGQRLDRWLKKRVDGLPYPLAMKLIRKGAIRIDGGRAKPETRLAQGQTIRIPAIEDNDSQSRKPRQHNLTEAYADYIRSLVIYDDGDVLAINKPYDLPAQGGTGVKYSVDAYMPVLADDQGRSPRLVHRLDKQTSGLMLLARSPGAVRDLGKAFRDRAASKLYLGVVTPAPDEDEGTINAPIAKAAAPNKDKMKIDEEDGKPAVTDFRVIEYVGKRAALVAFMPRTGRTHQIRVHAAYILGTPIIGDKRYGYQGDELGDLALNKRLHLHSYYLNAPHPNRKGELELTAPLTTDLNATWDIFEFPVAIDAGQIAL
jgi:23S rRNA pseudouridine955/2504/2580 synthase